MVSASRPAVSRSLTGSVSPRTRLSSAASCSAKTAPARTPPTSTVHTPRCPRWCLIRPSRSPRVKHPDRRGDRANMHPRRRRPQLRRGRGQLRHALCLQPVRRPHRSADQRQRRRSLPADHSAVYRLCREVPLYFHTGGQTGGLQQQEYPGFPGGDHHRQDLHHAPRLPQ